ncbi:MAG: ABC transporter substrate-binding protein [Thiomargarita sp.]|nr:ABC transporter substrate-binding protein [Thiomargarita sp.]
MKKILTTIALVCMLGVLPIDNNAYASSAEDVIRTTTDKVLKNPNRLRNEATALKLVNKVFSFYSMSKKVLGKNWKKASKKQKKRFIKAFRGLLVRTYSNALIEASGNVKRVEYSTNVKGKKATVRTQVYQKGKAAPIKVNYNMRKYRGKWKAYNVIVGGVSLVNNYRTEFANDIRTIGMDKLINKINGLKK